MFVFSNGYTVHLFTHSQDFVSEAITVALLVTIWVVSWLSRECRVQKLLFDIFYLGVF